MIRIEQQIEKKIKSILNSYGEIYEDWKNVFYSQKDITYQRTLEGYLISMRDELKMIKWMTGISYKKYVPVGVKIIGD